MATSGTVTFDLDRAGILRNAYQKIGIVPPGQDPTSDLLATGSDVLNVILKSWENKGVFQINTERTTTTLTAGTAEYTTDSDTLDIETRHPYVTDGQGNDTKVTMITRGRYMEITDKDTQGYPTLMMVEKTDRVRFTLYPVPDDTIVSITYPRTKLFQDMSTGANTTGLPAKYLKALILEVAIELCPGFSQLGLIPALRDSYVMAIEEATNDDTERGNVRMVPRYGIQFTRTR